MITTYFEELRRLHKISTEPRRGLREAIKSYLPFALRKIDLVVEVKADTFFGIPMKVVVPEMVSVSIWRTGFFEVDVSTYLLRILRPGDRFIDVGGHFGFFSLLGRKLVGNDGLIVTFEPMPRTRDILRHNLEQAFLGSACYVIPAAAGALPGRIKFKDFGLAGSAFATSEIERSVDLRFLGEVDVELRTVDSVIGELGLSNLRLIKIDAENAEYDVIQGSLETIATLRPAIILETGDSEAGSTRRVLDLLSAESYQPYEFYDWTIRPHAVMDGYGYQNLLLLPAELATQMLATS